MKFKKIISLILFLLIFAFYGCSNDLEQEVEPIQIYNSNSDKYYVAYATTSTPSLENFKFQIPIITDRELTELEDIKLYYKNEEILLDSIDNIDAYRVRNDIKDDKYKYLYTVRAVFNKKMFNDCLNIDKVSIKINGEVFNFMVDIKIVYKYIQTDYQTQIYPYYSNDVDNSCVKITYCLGCYGSYEGNKKITKISGNIIELSTSYTAEIYEQYSEEFLSNFEGFTIPRNDLYYLKFTVEGVKSFVSDAFELTIDYDGTEITYCSNNNMITCSTAKLVAMQELNY